jgi:SanA protein
MPFAAQASHYNARLMNDTMTTGAQRTPPHAPPERAQPQRGRVPRVALAVALLLTVAAVAFPWLWRGWVNARYAPRIYALEDAPPARVAVVFGARVYSSGRLSAMLRDRVDTGIELYRAGKVDKLLFSGDNQSAEYNEPGAMMAYALAQGVPADAIQPDYGGRRTYDTCYRAAAVFQVETALLVTQGFHLPRALLLCEALGMEVAGVAADRRTYDPRSVAWSEGREVPALLAALLDLIRRAPPPVLGDPIPL